MLNHILWILSLWASTLVIGIISWPITKKIFGKMSDKGYSVSKLFGFFIISYILFLGATLRISTLSWISILIIIILWALLNGYVLQRIDKATIKSFFQKIPWKQMVAIEIAFIILLSCFTLAKSYQPEIYQIERFMDFGFIQSLQNAKELPLFDIWKSGEPLNYYYGGHFIGHVVLTITNIPTVSGFFLLGGWIFSLLALIIYRLGKDLLKMFSIQYQSEGLRKRIQSASGILSVFTVLFAGTWFMIPWVYQQILHAFGRAELPSMHYPAPTRIIPGTITEMPIYSFIVADVHAHVWGLLSGILIFAILFCLWRDTKTKLDIQNKYLWAAAFILGFGYIINSWDAITLGLLTVVVVAVKYFKQEKFKILPFCIGIAVVAYALALPWSVFFHAPIQAIGLVKTHSPLWPWISFWGAFGAIIIAYIIRSILVQEKEKRKQHFKNTSFIIIIIAVAVLFLLIIDVAYLKDILHKGEWFRANTVFKITTQVWLWLGIITGPILLWLLKSWKRMYAQVIAAAIIAIFLMIQATYPIEAVKQALLGGKDLTGIDTGLTWWQTQSPNDFAAYEFLKDIQDTLPRKERVKNIIEAEGESYTDTSRFSVFLGWPTIIGWPIHEWTWTGSYDEVNDRRKEVREIYTGTDNEKTKELLQHYNTDYIIIGKNEEDRYKKELQTEKLKSFGETIFSQGNTIIIEVQKNRKN